jgi:hypothetical protein
MNNGQQHYNIGLISAESSNQSAAKNRNSIYGSRQWPPDGSATTHQHRLEWDFLNERQ